MTLKIIHKNSTSPGQAPAAGDLDIGEIGVNSADGALFIEDNNGDIHEFRDSVFTQSGTGAVNRYVDDRLKDVLSVKDFGAVGDGATNDSAAFQAAVDALVSEVGTKGAKSLYIPSGVYLLSDKVTASMSATGAWQSAEIFGDGAFSTILLASQSNSDGILKLTSDGNTERWQLNGITFASSLTNTDSGTNGTALEINSTVAPGSGGWGDSAKYNTILEDIHVVGYGDTVTENNRNAGFFNVGIKIENKWYCSLRSITVSRGFNRDEHAAGSIGIDFVNAYSPTIVNYYIYGPFETGIKYTGTDPSGGIEDFRFNEGFIVHPRYGIYVDHPDDSKDTFYEPGGLIVNNHIAADQKGVFIRAHRQVVLSNNYIYVSDAASPGSSGKFGAAYYPCIHLQSTGDITISNNQFLSPGYYISDTDCTVGILVTGYSQGLLAHGNIFNLEGIGLVLDYESQILLGADDYLFPPMFKDNMVNNGSGYWRLTKLQVDFTTGKNAKIHWLGEFANRTYISAPYQDDPAGNRDKLEEHYVYTKNTSGTDIASHVMQRTISDNTAGSEQTEWKFWTVNAGTLQPSLVVDEFGTQIPGGKVFSVGNERGVSGTLTLADGTLIDINGGIITGISTP